MLNMSMAQYEYVQSYLITYFKYKYVQSYLIQYEYVQSYLITYFKCYVHQGTL